MHLKLVVNPANFKLSLFQLCIHSQLQNLTDIVTEKIAQSVNVFYFPIFSTKYIIFRHNDGGMQIRIWPQLGNGNQDA